MRHNSNICYEYSSTFFVIGILWSLSFSPLE